MALRWRRPPPVRDKALPAINPNAGIAALYRKKMDALIAEMNRSYIYWLSAQYRDRPPAMMAEDATPAQELERELKQLGVRWQKRFDEAAPKLARWFAQSSSRRSMRTLQTILKDAGIAVEFKMTPPMRDVFEATVAENVGLIKSIASEYHTQVQGLVMRSVTAGRDLATLTDELQDRFHITRNRAKLIAIDQNNKSMSQMNRARQLDVGIEEGIWQHSHAGKEPRPTHLANNGKRFNLKTGWYDPDPRVKQHIWPGQLIRCRCTWRPVVKGFT